MLDDAYIAALKERASLFHVEHKFHKGQLVQHKPGLKHSKVGQPGKPVIVMEYPVEIKNEAPPNSFYHHDVLDMYVAEIDKDGDFVVWTVDSRRMEPYTE